MEINRQKAARILAANLKVINDLKKSKSSLELLDPIKEVYKFARGFQLNIDFSAMSARGIQR